MGLGRRRRLAATVRTRLHPHLACSDAYELRTKVTADGDVPSVTERRGQLAVSAA